MDLIQRNGHLANGLSVDFDGHWAHLATATPPPYVVSGKYLFFSSDLDQLLAIASSELLEHNFHRAKLNVILAPGHDEHVLCLYYSDRSRDGELAERARTYRCKYRRWKSDADTRARQYSREFLDRLPAEARTRLLRDR